MSTANKDFERFWQWFLHNYPSTTLTKGEALEEYNKFYSCTCDGCQHNKERGNIPRRVHPSCRLPITSFCPNPYPL